MAAANNFGLTALTRALNESIELEESADAAFALFEELSDDEVKRLAMDREVADVAADNSKIAEFIKTIPESENTDGVYRKTDIVKETLEALDALTEQLVMEGVV